MAGMADEARARAIAFGQAAFRDWARYSNGQVTASASRPACVTSAASAAGATFLRLLCQISPSLAASLPIPLVPATGDPDLLALSTRKDLSVEWRFSADLANSSIHGRLLAASIPDDNATDQTVATLVLGATFATLAPWLELARLIKQSSAPPSAAIQFALRLLRLPLTISEKEAIEGHLETRVDQALEQLAHDLEADPDGFDRLVRSAVDSKAHDEASFRLAKALQSRAQWRCWPPLAILESGQLAVQWTAVTSDLVRWRTGPEPYGTPLLEACRFAQNPSDAVVVMSEGPAIESPTLAALQRLCEPGSGLFEFAQLCTQLRKETILHERDGKILSAAEVIDLSQPLRRGLARLANHGCELPAVVCQDAETWLNGLGYRLVPRPPVVAASLRSEQSPLPLRFDNAERDTVVIEEFGLARANAGDAVPLVEWKAFRSVGKEPQGYTALLSAVARIDDAWRQRFERLPQAILDRQGESFAARLFGELHEAIGGNPRLAELVAPLLEMLERTWRIVAFSPANETEYPERYIQNVATNLNRRGLVRRVLCPGLRDDKRLWLKAIVELE